MVSLKWNFHNLIRIPQTWNCCNVISVSLLEIDDELIRCFTDAACDGDASLVNELLDDGVPVDSEYGFWWHGTQICSMEEQNWRHAIIIRQGSGRE